MRYEPSDLSLQTHRRLIGWLGFLLPILLFVLAGLRPTATLPRWQPLDSVSAYYYSGAVAVFVGVLFALSLFLFAYRGYEGVRADRNVGKLGGFAALGVALFPTPAPPGLHEPTWWRCAMGVIHFGSAVLLFVAFILFALWLFRKSDVPKGSPRPPQKKRRDDICLVCGIVMSVCILLAAGLHFAHLPIFWPEAIAIVAFAISWLAKGEAHKPIARAVRKISLR